MRLGGLALVEFFSDAIDGGQATVERGDNLLRARRPDVQIAYTFYSPSAEQFAATVRADFSDYLPFDTAEHASAVLSALRPNALVFSKLDIWPTLTESAATAGVPVGVISATLPKSSRRRGPLARS